MVWVKDKWNRLLGVIWLLKLSLVKKFTQESLLRKIWPLKVDSLYLYYNKGYDKETNPTRN